jgi:hypothetical protein
VIAPITRLVLQQRRKIADLRARCERLAVHVIHLGERVEVLERQRDQARRDSELLALCARDREVALGILRDAHGIQGLDETA